MPPKPWPEAALEKDSCCQNLLGRARTGTGGGSRAPGLHIYGLFHPSSMVFFSLHHNHDHSI